MVLSLGGGSGNCISLWEWEGVPPSEHRHHAPLIEKVLFIEQTLHLPHVRSSVFSSILWLSLDGTQPIATLKCFLSLHSLYLLTALAVSSAVFVSTGSKAIMSLSHQSELRLPWVGACHRDTVGYCTYK